MMRDCNHTLLCLMKSHSGCGDLSSGTLGNGHGKRAQIPPGPYLLLQVSNPREARLREGNKVFPSFRQLHSQAHLAARTVSRL